MFKKEPSVYCRKSNLTNLSFTSQFKQVNRWPKWVKQDKNQTGDFTDFKTMLWGFFSL